MGTVILGAGVTGLAAGIASDAPVFEAADGPGGICSSYYVVPGTDRRLPEPPADRGAYRFEIGGGHWIFGGDAATLRYVNAVAPLEKYSRRSSVYFPENRQFVPYPLQNHLGHLPFDVAARALAEMAQPARRVPTMREWHRENFGPTLCELFFDPFHELYTAGLHDRIAPQDAYKSPVDLPLAIRGLLGEAPAVGYNVDFRYPREGLGALVRRMAAGGRVAYGKRAVRIDLRKKAVEFDDGSGASYDVLLSTVPLVHTVAMAGMAVDGEPDPYTSVLVLNIGARRGPAWPSDQWLYVPRSRAGFHRVGIYDNVDVHFLPRDPVAPPRTSLYVERAYVGGRRPGAEEVARYGEAVIAELRDWGFIDAVEVLDPTWIDVAYTWSWPGSRWVTLARSALEAHDVHPIGRYGRWVFQGIAESLREGFAAGAAARSG
jgi:protoporphyrinogen oxidase